MQDKIVVIGLGEMGSVFARGFLKLGLPVYPILRTMSLQQQAQHITQPRLVIVAVGEADIHQTIADMPNNWREHVVLLQNELLPRDWQAQLANPTVISVWFEKKKGQDSKVVIPSPIYGPNAALLQQALATLDIPSYIVANKEALLFELIRKNIYILTSNIAGLKVGGTVGELWQNHRDFATRIVVDVLKIQEKLTNTSLALEPYLQAMLTAFEGDLAHKCMGRTAAQRLARAIQQAETYNLSIPTLLEIKASTQ